jgi:hypothetical protein
MNTWVCPILLVEDNPMGCFRHQVLLGGQSRSSSGKGDRLSRVEEHE